MTEIDNILSRFEKKGLVKGFKTFRNKGIDFRSIEKKLNEIVVNRIDSKRYGEVLSLIYISGRYFNQNIENLILKLFEMKDYPTVLKQAFRFDIYSSLKKEIDFAIDWHINSNKVDGFAWKVKFQAIEQTTKPLSKNNVYDKIIEEESIETNKFITLTIAPINKQKNTSVTLSTNKFIQIQYDKNKLDRANISHANTQKILEKYLSSFNISSMETKHIDVYAKINENEFLFEIKSITQRNERPQTRSAVSQLYEYSFLYGIENPIYFVLFSSKPENIWLIDYLENERDIRVIWIGDKGKLEGASLKILEKNCVQHLEYN